MKYYQRANAKETIVLTGLLLSTVACGVKGPPLPPVSDTPESSEREDVERARVNASPTPSPTPSPSPTPKKKKR